MKIEQNQEIIVRIFRKTQTECPKLRLQKTTDNKINKNNKWKFAVAVAVAELLFIHCFQVELEFRSVGFCGGRKTLVAGTRTVNELIKVCQNGSVL